MPRTKRNKVLFMGKTFLVIISALFLIGLYVLFSSQDAAILEQPKRATQKSR
jgi:hypothetical protein